MFLSIPKNKTYPVGSVQCDDCGGNGCVTCSDNGWLPAGHPRGRECAYFKCKRPLPPNRAAIYCCNDCANADIDRELNSGRA